MNSKARTAEYNMPKNTSKYAKQLSVVKPA